MHNFTIAPLCILFCFFLPSAGAWGQNSLAPVDSMPKGPDHLLWYRGKRKNDTTLLLSTGAAVRYCPSTNSVEVKLPPKQDLLQLINDECLKTPQREEQAKAILLKGPDALANYPIYKEVKKAYEHEKKSFEEVTTSKLELPQVDQGKTIKEQVDNLLRECPQKEQEFNEIVAWVKQHKSDQDFELPVPPDMDYEHCWDCDAKKQELYDRAVHNYVENFFKEEEERIRKLFQLQRTLLLLGFNENGSFGIAADDPSNKAVHELFFDNKKTACPWMPSAMSQAPELILRLIVHADEKAYALFKKYRKDFHHLEAVTRVLLSVSRDKALITGYCADEQYLTEIAGAYENFLYDLKGRLKKPDYYTYTNTRLFFQLARGYMMAGGQQLFGDSCINWYLRYNRFKLHFDIDCKEGSDGGYIVGHVKGDNFVRIVSDSANCIGFVRIESSDMEGMAHPKEQNLNLQLEAADFVAPSPRPVYTGTHEWQTTMPDFKLHLCEEGKDTLIVHTIFPKDFKEMWNMPGLGQMNTGMIQSLLLGCFLDKGHVEESASEVEGHEEEVKTELKQEAAKMDAEAQKYRKQTASGKPPSSEQALKFKKMGEEMLATARMTKYAPHALGNYFFQVKFKNEKIMIEESLDGKKLFPDNEGTIYAHFRIQLVQDPMK